MELWLCGRNSKRSRWLLYQMLTQSDELQMHWATRGTRHMAGSNLWLRALTLTLQ